MDQEKIGKFIAECRKENNLTQEQMSELVGINSRSISLIERGSNFVTAETLTNIAKTLNVSIKKLFDFDEDIIQTADIKERLFDLINKNEDKVYTIYKIVRGYLE